MPAKKPKSSPRHQTVAPKAAGKPATKASPKPAGKEVSARGALPTPKISSLKDGFVRISDTHVRKIYG